MIRSTKTDHCPECGAVLVDRSQTDGKQCSECLRRYVLCEVRWLEEVPEADD